MMSNNICKFTTRYFTNDLTISNFIFEQDKNTMSKKIVLGTNSMILMSSGKCTFYFGKYSVLAESGMLVFGFKGENFYAEPDNDTEYMYVSFDGIRSREIFERFGIDEDSRAFSGFQSVVPLWKESLIHADKLTIDLAAESMLLYAFSKLSAEEMAKNNIVGKMIEYTKENFQNSSLSISVLSDKFKYNSKYLSHIFKKQTGVGYTEYLREMRLKFAISLFDNGLDSVKNVAILSGFSDPLYFSAIFKKSMNISPKEYANKASAANNS